RSRRSWKFPRAWPSTAPPGRPGRARSVPGSTASRRPPMPLRLDSRDPGFEAAFRDLLSAKRETEADVNDAVAGILADVKKRGDAAMRDYTRRCDRFELTAKTMAFTKAEIAPAREA